MAGDRNQDKRPGEEPFRFELEIDEENAPRPLPPANGETPIEAGDAPPPSAWRNEDAWSGNEAYEVIQVPLDRTLPTASERKPSIADAEPAQVSEAAEHKPAAPAPARKRRRVVRRVKRKRRHAAPAQPAQAKEKPKRASLAGRLFGRGAQAPSGEQKDETPQAPPVPAKPKRERRPTRKRARRRAEAASAQRNRSPAASAPLEPPTLESAVVREPAPADEQPAAASRPEPAPDPLPTPPSLPLDGDASKAPVNQAERDPQQTAEAQAENKPSLLARLLAALNRPIGKRKPAPAEAETQPDEPQPTPPAPPSLGDEEPSAADSGPEEKRPSALARLLAALNRPIGKPKADEAAEEKPDERKPKARRTKAPEASPAPASAPVERPAEPAPAAPSAEAADLAEPRPPATLVSGPERPSDAPAEPPAGKETPAPETTSTRKLVSAGLSAEERRAELERRRLERRRRAEQRRERRKKAKRLVRRIREGVVGFFQGLIDEESEAWAKRKERLEQRKRRREEKRAERERKKAERKAAREANPSIFTKLRQRIDAKRAARARKLGRNIAGLEISASTLRAVHLREGQPIEVWEMPLPDGVIVDGILEEPDELSRAIKQLWKESQLKTKKVNFSIPTNRKVTMRTVALAAENPEDVSQALAFKARRIIEPMDPDESIIDYAELSRSGPHVDIQLAAADEEMVKKYASAVSKAGLLAASCEIGGLAASRAIVVPRSPRHAQLIIDIGAETTTVAAASGPDVFYLRPIELGGNNFTEAIHDKLGLSYTEARELKERIGLAGPLPEGVDADLARRARETMRPVADRLAQEISQTRRAYEEAVFDGERVGREIKGYLVLGGGAKLTGLVEQIELFAALPVRHELRPYPGLEQAGKDLDVTATCLGLARGHTMSLLPDLSPASFTLSNPLRRKAKISMADAERQAKRLAAARRRTKQAGTDPRLIGALIGALAIAGAYMIDQRREPDTSALTDPIVAETDAPPMRINYPNNADAGRIAESLLTTPQTAALSGMPKIFARHGAEITQVSVSGSRVLISAISEKGAAAERVESAARKSVPEAQSVSLQTEQATGKKQPFTLIIDIPHQPRIGS